MELKIPQGHFSGKALKRISAANLVLVESLYLPNFKLEKHSHANACFCFVIEGAFNETYGRKQRSCPPSTLLFRPSDESHFDHFQNAKTRCLNIDIEADLLERLNDYSKINIDSVELRDVNLITTAQKLYSEFLWMDNISGLAIEGLSLEMLAGLSRSSTQETGARPPRWLEKVRERLHEEFSENTSITELSTFAGVHPVHLSRTFRRYYRCTVGDYIRQIRIKAACHLLSKSDISLSQIALNTGFSHQSHFSLSFKRFTGLTPARYRLLSRKH